MKTPIILDGQRIEISRGNPLIRALKKAGIYVPTLCHHENLKPYGSCRLCMVEVIEKGQRKLVTSCTYPVEPGMEVLTDTPQLRQIRRMLIRLLLARSPDSDVLTGMAKKLGIEAPGFAVKGTNNCILCGLCVRFCEEVVGVSAIGLANRGVAREVTTPFKLPSEVCIGCGSCTYICPTGCIEMKLDKKKPGMHTIEMGKLPDTPCPDDYRCRTCNTEEQFLQDMRTVIIGFRNKFSGKGHSK
jgi:NADH dehydrogenase/NADH:ubiquinone oxidoreductase subunit G